MKKIISLLLAVMMCFLMITFAYQKNAMAVVGIDDAVFAAILMALMSASGIALTGGIEACSWDGIKTGVKEWWDGFKDKCTLFGAGIPTLFFSMCVPSFWQDKVKVNTSGDVTGVDITKDMVDAVQTAYDAVYGAEGSETVQGNTPVVNVPSGDYTVTPTRGYFMTQPDIVSAVFEKNYSGGYDTETKTTTSGNVELRLQYYGFECSVTGTDVVYNNAVIFLPRWWVNTQILPLSTNIYNYSYIVEKDSEAYNFILSGAYSGVGEKAGFIKSTNANYTLQYTNFKRYTEKFEFNRNPSMDNPIYNSQSSTTGAKLIIIPTMESKAQYTADTYEFISGFNITSETHDVITGSTMPVTVVVDSTKFAAAVQGWENAISQGQVDQTEALTIAIANSTEQMITAQNLGLAGMAQTTTAGSQAIVDSIAEAQAAIAAATQAGELELERLTLKTAIMTRFPFCIPFDLYHAFAGLDGYGRAAPHWQLSWTVLGTTATIDIDFSQYEKLAGIIRWGILILFNIGLILVTRKLIKG